MVVSRSGRLGTKWDGGEPSGPVQGCVCGMDEKAATCIEVMWSGFEPWVGVDGMSAGGCEDSGWHAGQHDLPQDESRYANSAQ